MEARVHMSSMHCIHTDNVSISVEQRLINSKYEKSYMSFLKWIFTIIIIIISCLHITQDVSP